MRMTIAARAIAAVLLIGAARLARTQAQLAGK